MPPTRTTSGARLPVRRDRLGCTIKILHITDEFTWESLSALVAHSIDADATVATLDRIVTRRGQHPDFIRCDNEPELTASALRDWCRFTGSGTSCIDPRQPVAEPLGRVLRLPMRDELLAIVQFDTLLEAVCLSPTGKSRQRRSPALSPQHAHSVRVRRSLATRQT